MPACGTRAAAPPAGRPAGSAAGPRAAVTPFRSRAHWHSATGRNAAYSRAMRPIILLLAVMGCSGKETPASNAAPSGGGNTAAATSPGSPATSRPASVTDDMVASTDRIIVGLTALADDLDAAADCKAATAALRNREKSMHAVK